MVGFWQLLFFFWLWGWVSLSPPSLNIFTVEALRERRPPWSRQIITPILWDIRITFLSCTALQFIHIGYFFIHFYSPLIYFFPPVTLVHTPEYILKRFNIILFKFRLLAHHAPYYAPNGI